MLPQQHYQVVYSPQSDTYQVQRVCVALHIKSTCATTYPTYLAALEASAAAATPECPLIAWGFVVNGPQDTEALKSAALWQDAYGEAWAVGHRYAKTGATIVFSGSFSQIS